MEYSNPRHQHPHSGGGPKPLSRSSFAGSISKILDPNLENLKLAMDTTEEGARLKMSKGHYGFKSHWKNWGPYVSDRAWGTVREDYSHDGNAWEFFPHDHARSRSYRWNEDGLGGFCNRSQNLIMSLGFWNERDPFLKERFFGLTGPQGSHGEDVKEYYYYLDATPTYSYCKMLYKYPHRAFPYTILTELNNPSVRYKDQGELELVDVLRDDFEKGRYFDIEIEYAKAGDEDIICKVTVHNRAKAEYVQQHHDRSAGEEQGFIFDDHEDEDEEASPAAVEDANLGKKEGINRDGSATIHVLPHCFYRNRWSWGYETAKHPTWVPTSPSTASSDTQETFLGMRYVNFVDQDGQGPSEMLFCENETNFEKIFGEGSRKNENDTCKDGINDFVVDGQTSAAKCVTPENAEASKATVAGSKLAGHFSRKLAPGESYTVYFRMSDSPNIGYHYQASPEFLEGIVRLRKKEADMFYQIIQNPQLNEDERMIQRQAWAGLLWSCQYYHFSVKLWLDGDPWLAPPPDSRRNIRNSNWRRFHAGDVISMPDKWEYPWFAAWDLAFHVVPLAYLDPEFAKGQLLLMLREWYMHSNGQLAAYEWNFSDVNPPVHAWACWRVYSIEKQTCGEGDITFLKRVYTKLLLNFTWWVNRKDKDGKHIFEGGFLGLDNISVFDRSGPSLQPGDELHQADGTAWMAMFSLDMLRIALELAVHDSSFEDSATKFFEHFVFIAAAINGTRSNCTNMCVDHGLWDEKNGFFFDQITHGDGSRTKLEVYSYVGLIPLLAVEIIPRRMFEMLPNFRRRVDWLIKHHPEVVNAVPNLEISLSDPTKNVMLSIVDQHQLERILTRMVNPKEFLSDYGVRSLSKFHKEHPFTFRDKSIGYEPAESQSMMFGGNSNWRGPIWFPINYLIVESLHRYHFYYQKEITVRVKLTGIGTVSMDLNELAYEIKSRLVRVFHRPTHGQTLGMISKLGSRNNVLLARSQTNLKSIPEKLNEALGIEEDDDKSSDDELNQGRACFGDDQLFQEDPHWRDHLLFHEYFNGDSGQGLGASHQTGWTGLIAKILQGSGQRHDGAFRF